MAYEFTHRLPHEPARKPSRNEEEYFARKEFEERRARAREREAKRSEEESRRLQEKHQDRCPRCGVELERLEMKDVAADQCPICHGVWLEQESFDALTQEDRGPLADLFRDVFVEHSLHGITRARDEAEAEADEG